MKKSIVFIAASTLLFICYSAKADYVKKGAFICRSKELLDEMISASAKYADAKKIGNESRALDEMTPIASLITNGQCSITDKDYKASLLDFGFTKHKIRIYDDKGGNFVVWTISEDYVK